MDEHQTFCLDYPFKDGITFMCLSTPHMLLNFTRMTNCGWQKQIHLDGAFNFCVKDFGLVGIGYNLEQDGLPLQPEIAQNSQL
jgi:hypothetical protein